MTRSKRVYSTDSSRSGPVRASKGSKGHRPHLADRGSPAAGRCRMRNPGGTSRMDRHRGGGGSAPRGGARTDGYWLGKIIPQIARRVQAARWSRYRMDRRRATVEVPVPSASRTSASCSRFWHLIPPGGSSEVKAAGLTGSDDAGDGAGPDVQGLARRRDFEVSRALSAR